MSSGSTCFSLFKTAVVLQHLFAILFIIHISYTFIYHTMISKVFDKSGNILIGTSFLSM